MDEETRNRLAIKKQSAQEKQEVAAQSRLLADWWLPTLELVQNAGIEWRLEYLTTAGDDQLSHWAMQLQQMPWAKFPIEKLLVFAPSPYVHESVATFFPGTHPLRYLPQLASGPATENSGGQQILKEAAQQMGIGDQPVFFFFMRLSAVLQLRFDDLVTLAAQGIFDAPEDSCVAPADYSWLVFRSLEGEWQYGKR